VCGLFTTKHGGLAIRQLTSHVSAVHPGYRWTHRYCSGPSHDGRIVYVPLRDFNRRGRSENWRRECKACESLIRERRLGYPAGYVALARIRPFVDHLVLSLGIARAATFAGVSEALLYQLQSPSPNRLIQKRIARRLLVAVRSLNADGSTVEAAQTTKGKAT